MRNQLTALKELNRQVLFSDRENLDLSRDEALASLTTLAGLPGPPRRIEAYDISHTGGTDTTASMVVFVNGAPFKTAYRKFKIRGRGNDDFAHIKEVISRRLSPKNVARWLLPDLVLIDGGKGQLSSAIDARNRLGQSQILMIGLSKRYEQIIIARGDLDGPKEQIIEAEVLAAKGQLSTSKEFLAIGMPVESTVVKLLQRIRDESHRFALSYHNTLRAGRQTASLLDEIPGIGPVSQKKLISRFGSAKAVSSASPEELSKLLGNTRGRQVYSYIKATYPPS